MTKEEADNRALELSMRPQRFAWHQDERTKEIANVAAPLSTSMLILERQAYQYDLKRKLD